MISDILELNGISINLLSKLSYKSQLGTSLKRTLSHFNKESLIDEIFSYADHLDSLNISSIASLDFRVKSYESILNKYERYYPNKQAEKVFNDILGFRAFCDDYAEVLECSDKTFKIADMSSGKANDDGYRGVHVYYQIDHTTYPIEIQFNTLFDRQINNWLHDYLYKTDLPNEYGAYLRHEYEHGAIRNLKDFREMLNNDLLGGKEQI